MITVKLSGLKTPITLDLPEERSSRGYLPLLFVILIWLASHPSALAQESPGHIVSPEVSADRRVTFRFRAPKAMRVSVSMDGYRRALHMTKDLSGVWSVTTDPLVPDFYGYSIVRDGLRLFDPNNPMVNPNLFIR